MTHGAVKLLSQPFFKKGSTAMIRNDYPVHTAFSTDSEAPVQDQIERMIQLGMDRICITDHEDLYFPAIPEDYPGIPFPFNLDLPVYIQEVQAFRETYAGKIDVRMGIELGLTPRARREYHQIFDNYRHGSLAPILDLRDGKYFFVREYVQYTGRLLFKEKFYYRGIPGWNVSGLVKNPQQ